MECSRCQAEQAAGAKYCGGCGRPVQVLSCGHCRTSNPATSRFCHECGRALAGAPTTAREDRTVVPAADDSEEIKDSAFWEAYADRTGIPAAGLIEIAPGPAVARRESPVDDRDRRRPLRRGRERGLYATLQEDRERRRPVRIVVAAGTILAVGLILLVLSTTSWRTVLGPEWLQSTVVPSDPTIASPPILEPVPAPADPASPPLPVEGDPAPAEEIEAPSPPARSSAVALGTQPSRTPAAPRTSAERMATYLVGRNGPERAIQTALEVARFYPESSDEFRYWHRVAAAIRASAASPDASGEAVGR
ncbi:MAG TPA: zinc ribbon domain-containing protein [Methylomirabilota bacterium]|jgi:hypothetical protein